MAEENKFDQKPSGIFVDRDVLGQEKTTSNTSATSASPGKIFVVIAIVIIVAIVYWLITGK